MCVHCRENVLLDTKSGQGARGRIFLALLGGDNDIIFRNLVNKTILSIINKVGTGGEQGQQETPRMPASENLMRESEDPLPSSVQDTAIFRHMRAQHIFRCRTW